MPKKISKEKSINRTKTFTELFVCAVIVGTGIYIGKSCFDRTKTVPNDPTVETSDNNVEVIDTTEPEDPDKTNFLPTPVNTRLKFTGDLILVNNKNQYYSSGNEPLVSIMEKNDETGRSCFTAVDYDYTILSHVYEPMAQMIQDWYDQCQNDTLIVYGSYRTNEFQQQLYDQFTAQTSGDDEAPIVAKPGFSEHETGYAFDFSETVDYDYQGEGDFKWLNDNCHKYGFIIRYPKDKEDITEYRAEPWHFRYVGKPHSLYMKENNLCLEEYIELLRNAYSYEGDHLETTDDEGKHYEIFFFQSADGSDYTNVPIPTDCKYDISGNNVDGFIVTVHKDEPSEPNAEHPFMTTPVQTEEPTETSDEDGTSDETTDTEASTDTETSTTAAF